MAKRLRNGENGAMQEFYTLYAEQLAGVCARYIVDKEDMKDVFQESLVQIISHICDFNYRGEGSLEAWATRIVVNESLKFLRTAKQQELLLLEQDTTEEPEPEAPHSITMTRLSAKNGKVSAMSIISKGLSPEPS